ncbi:hypothetical protein ncot_02570 [Nocardioides sp. JQ2195]|uniref:hypothetical protein n=1 Tax=Nocardioides sp. JQ2195 TaxID=2592334 RepID=UPI00143E299A|nr:hypothetical protein [Nocardioides sp. JQ2195]QIX25598.1 hypothetical protein ncot_02570 [Nocardioides sp. JQ2195]
MRIDWVPASAASLIAGVTSLGLGAALLPGGDSAADSIGLVEQHDSRWLAVSLLFFIAAVGMTLGLPAILKLFPNRGFLLGIIGSGVFLIGCLGTAGYAMLLAFFRALALSNAIRPEAVGEVVDDPGLAGFLVVWIAAFFLGELLLGLALLRARTTPRWVPVLLIAHVATLPLSSLVPDLDGSWTIVLMCLGFAGAAIAANTRELPRDATSPH